MAGGDLGLAGFVPLGGWQPSWLCPKGFSRGFLTSLSQCLSQFLSLRNTVPLPAMLLAFFGTLGHRVSCAVWTLVEILLGRPSAPAPSQVMSGVLAPNTL